MDEIKNYLTFPSNTTYVDCTLGFGGHMEAMIEANPSIHTCLGIDMDESHIDIAKKRLEPYSSNRTLIFEHSRFEHMEDLCRQHGLHGKVTSILFDLGICSAHVDNADRGFSFLKDGPLDMRMDQSQSLTAQQVVNNYSEKDLADIIFHYGEERASRKIARMIVHNRKETPYTTTLQLAEDIGSLLKGKPGKHPATKVFQALRIEVNQELKQVEIALQGAINCLAPGGRLAVLTYHSLEDRITKRLFKDAAREYTYDNGDPTALPVYTKQVTLLQKKPILPKDEEICYNKRSRSAKLRLIEKI